jgi:hypothetical protein
MSRVALPTLITAGHWLPRRLRRLADEDDCHRGYGLTRHARQHGCYRWCSGWEASPAVP